MRAYSKQKKKKKKKKKEHEYEMKLHIYGNIYTKCQMYVVQQDAVI
jgi:hypothetical protein